jgi:release factor glutamine methyltransferase
MLAEAPPEIGPSIGTLVDRLARSLADSSHVEDVHREAREIVAALLDMPRSWPVRHSHEQAPPALVARAVAAAEARGRGMPLPYAVGRAAFRHLTLSVDPRVLIPRPETEGLIDLVLAHGLRGGVAVDVGTGSGAVALALAQEGQFDRIIATDVSSDALAVAASNARDLRSSLPTPVEFREGVGLAPLEGVRARAIVSNPPYISWHEAADLPASVRDWEPSVALLSGADGLGVTRVLVRDAATVLETGGLLALEVDVRRAEVVARLLEDAGRYADVAVHRDLFGRDRFVTAVRARIGDSDVAAS